MLRVKSIWIYRKAMSSCRDTCNGIGDVIFLVQQIPLSFKQSNQCTGYITESDEGKFVVHESSCVIASLLGRSNLLIVFEIASSQRTLLAMTYNVNPPKTRNICENACR